MPKIQTVVSQRRLKGSWGYLASARLSRAAKSLD